jgi:hypothetical protein
MLSSLALAVAPCLVPSIAPARQDGIRPSLGPEIWISRAQIHRLPVIGPEWERVLGDAQRTLVPDIADKEDRTDSYVLAAALVAVRTGVSSFRDRARAACLAVTAVTPPSEFALADSFGQAWTRNVTSYVIAAGLVGLEPAEDHQFRAWLRASQPFLRRIHRTRPNNIGTHAGAARAAIAIYLEDAAEEQQAWDVFRRWLGDESSPFQFQQSNWGGSECSWQWQAEPYPEFFGINPPGAIGYSRVFAPHAQSLTPIPRDISGALPDELRRGEPECACPLTSGGCSFTWPPPKTNYTYEALQGVLAQAVIHGRRGRDAWTIAPDPFHGHGAILRAYEWLRDVAKDPLDDPVNGHDDLWQGYVVNQVYGGTPAFVPLIEVPGPVGKALGYADWITLEPSWP